MTVQIRSFVDKDLPSLVKLLNRTFKNSYQFMPYTEMSLRSWVNESKLRILIAEENGKVLGSIAYNDGHWGEEIEWLTVKDNSNEKLEEMMIKEIEEYVRKGTIFTLVDAGSPKIDKWIERGYKPEGGMHHMFAKLDAVKPLPKVPENTILRSLKPDEEEEFVRGINAGFGWERLKMGSIERWKTENPPFTEEWIHVAEVDNKIVSVVVAKPDTHYNGFFKGNRGYLGPAATLAEYRSKNLASALTVCAMNYLFEKGMDSVALYTSEQNNPSVTLLQKLGFGIVHQWKFMKKHLNS